MEAVAGFAERSAVQGEAISKVAIFELIHDIKRQGWKEKKKVIKREMKTLQRVLGVNIRYNRYGERIEEESNARDDKG